LNNPEEQEAQAQADTNPEPDPTAQAAALDQSWWGTGNAMRYFGAIDDEVSPKEAAEKGIKKLQKGHANATGWKLTIDDFDQQELCSDHDIFTFRLKCGWVSLAL
jgi:hypothetical protein